MSRSNIAIYAAVVAIWIIDSASIITLPVFVGPIMDAFNITERDIGLIAGVQLGALGVTSIWLSTHIQGYSLFAVARLGLTLTFIGHLLSIFTGSVWVFAACRFVAGIGEGCALSAGNAAGAGHHNPERIFAVGLMGISINTFLMLATFPYLIEMWDYRAGITAMITVMLVISPLIAGFPRKVEKQIAEHDVPNKVHFPFKVVGTLLLAANSLMFLAYLGLWIFLERIGTQLGLSPQKIGFFLALTTTFGLLGPLMAAVVHVRFGRVLPFSIGLLLLAASCFGIGHAPNVTIFMIALIPLNWAIMFLSPYFLGAFADLDPKGSWTTLSGGVTAIAIGLGPPIVGWIAISYGYTLVSTILSMIVLLSLTFVIIALRYQSRN